MQHFSRSTYRHSLAPATTLYAKHFSMTHRYLTLEKFWFSLIWWDNGNTLNSVAMVTSSEFESSHKTRVSTCINRNIIIMIEIQYGKY